MNEIEESLIRLIETNVGSGLPRTPGARVTFEMPPPDAPMPTFMSQAMFRYLVMQAERIGLDPRYVVPGPVLVHPDSLAWYMERLALGRMREHFGMLS